TASGVYEAEFPAEDVGAYFVNVVGEWKDKDGNKMVESVRGGVVIPYSPEFAELESNTTLLERIRETTGRKTFGDDADLWTRVARTSEVFRPLPFSRRGMQPIWMWLVGLAGVLLFFDVAVRRISIDPAKVRAAAVDWWARLRGAEAADTPAYLE